MLTEMYNPAHPGKILQEWVKGMNVSVPAFAKHIGVSRTLLSRVVNGKSAISADISLRISSALGTHESFWYEMQTDYDWAQAKHRMKRPKIKPLPRLEPKN